MKKKMKIRWILRKACSGLTFNYYYHSEIGSFQASAWKQINLHEQLKCIHTWKDGCGFIVQLFSLQKFKGVKLNNYQIIIIHGSAFYHGFSYDGLLQNWKYCQVTHECCVLAKELSIKYIHNKSKGQRERVFEKETG